jgi:5'-3' exonuclease
VGAVAGFCNLLWGEITATRRENAPTHLAVIFDAGSKTFRNDIYPAYKANRPELPEDLRPQFAFTRTASRAFNVPCIEIEGFEADDIIATYARLAREAGGTATIISSDKDLMQLMGDGIDMLDPMKNKRLTLEDVAEKFGVAPNRVVDVQALAGDSVDNVPGAPGIGLKTAALLINEYGDLDALLARAGEIKQPKRREALVENAELIRISRQLVSLDANAADFGASLTRCEAGWFAVPPANGSAGELAARFGVSQVPSLVVLRRRPSHVVGAAETNEESALVVVSLDAARAVFAGEAFPWAAPKTVLGVTQAKVCFFQLLGRYETRTGST